MPSQVNRYYNYINDYAQKEPDGSRSILGAAAAVASIAGTAYGIYSDRQNQARSDEALEWQKLMDALSYQFANKQFNEGVRQYNQNFAMEQKAMDLTQSNFENSAQIRTADMAKAGLNPLNYSGSDGASVSFSGGSNVAGSPVSSSVGNNQVNSTGAALLMELAKMKFESRERAKDRKSAENIANISANASMYGSDLQSDQAAALLAQRQSEFVQNFGLAVRAQDEKERAAKMAEHLQKAGLDESAARRKADSLAHSEEIRVAYEKLALAEKELAQAKTSKEAEIAAQNKRTWIMFISNLINTAAGVATSLVGGGSSAN